MGTFCFFETTRYDLGTERYGSKKQNVPIFPLCVTMRLFQG